MRVAIVMPLGEQRGGAELALEHLVMSAPPGRVEWHVLFLEPGPMVQSLRQLGARVDVLDARRLRNVGRALRTIVAIAAILRRRRIDVVLGWMAKAQLYAGPAGWLAGVPTAWFQLGAPYSPDFLDRLATALPARAILAPSDAAADAQRAVWPRRTTRTVYLGVDLERFDAAGLPDPAACREQLNLASRNGPLIGIFGRLQRWKGMHTLVQAMPAVLERHPDARCVIVGGEHDLEPGYREELERSVDSLGLDGHVVLAGFQSDVPLWMNAMDVLVHASDREPLGLVVLEGMALGKPMVAGDGGGPVEVVEPGRSGLLTPFEDADALASALVRLLDDPAAARRMGEEARRRADDFSVTHYAENLVSALEDVAAER
jgi:glycosyltransferase involved in cell wall biosynthesis